VEPDEFLLRDVEERDLAAFFEHQRDPAATHMAAFPARDREAFAAHWARVMADESVMLKTIVCGGQVAGNVVSWERDGRRLVGYWLGREFWGRGLASRSLAEFLGHVEHRPLHAEVAQSNRASIRVLEKCGFKAVEEFDDGDAPGIVFELRGT
jgi:RimJ/RimL family protein N-acetyltransferase